MSNIIKSATKICLLVFVLASVAGLFVGKIDSAQFVQFVTMVLSFYFGQKSAQSTAE